MSLVFWGKSDLPDSVVEAPKLEKKHRVLALDSRKACGNLLKLPDAKKWTAKEITSVSSLVKFWEQHDCATNCIQVKKLENGLEEVPLPGMMAVEKGWGLVAGWDGEKRSAAVIFPGDSSVKWMAWDSVFPEITSDEFVTISRRSKVEIDPEVWFPGGTIDLGLIEGDKPTQKEITFFNRGTSPLQIKDHRFSCGCAAADLKKKVIQPGEFCRMKVDIDVSKMDIEGLSLKWFVSSEKGNNKVIPLNARVRKPVEFSPDYFFLGDIPPSAPIIKLSTTVSASAFVTLSSVEPIRLEQGLKVHSVEDEGTNKKIHLIVNALEAKRDSNGFFRVEGMFAVNVSGERLFVVLGAAGRLESWIKPYPAIVNLAKVQPGETYERKVQFDAHCSGKAKVSVVHPEYVQFAIKEDVITLSILAPELPHVFRTGVLLRIGDESVNIPIVGELEEPNSTIKNGVVEN